MTGTLGSSVAAEAASSLSSSSQSPPLSPAQLHALFDILTHHEVYQEIQSLKWPSTVSSLGYPFVQSAASTPPTGASAHNHDAGVESGECAAGAKTKATATATAKAIQPLLLSRPFTPAPTPSHVPTTSAAAAAVPAAAATTAQAQPVYAAQTSVPILHRLLNRFVLTWPPTASLPPDFWSVRVQGMLVQLAEANLSESYDQGSMGTRKTLATAASALIESLGRGFLGGLPGGSTATSPDDARPYADRGTPNIRSGADSASDNETDGGCNPRQHGSSSGQSYDMTSAADYSRAWYDVLRGMVYGNLVEELVLFCTQHENIEEYSPAVQAVVDMIIIYLAEFIHDVFVLSPSGRYLTKLAESIQQRIPYSLVRQTLRVGNAATMINAMMRVLLTKLGVGSLTNWVGLTASADDGMNLLQRIISIVLSYDAANFKKAAEKIEKAKHGPSKAHLAALREHLQRPRQYRDAIRQESMDKGMSCVAAILAAADPKLLTSLTPDQHTLCAQYYAAQLSMRDRRELSNVFCRQNPDLFTHAVRDSVAAFDPILRRIHDSIDLKEHVGDLEAFVDEFLAVSKGTEAEPGLNSRDGASASATSSANVQTRLPTIDDYVHLLRRNRHSLYKFLHRIAVETPDIRNMFSTWATGALREFRTASRCKAPADVEGKRQDQRSGADVVGSRGCKAKASKGSQEGELRPRTADGAGAMDGDLCAMFSALPQPTQDELLPLIDAHAEHLLNLDNAANARMQRLLDHLCELEAATGDDEADDGHATHRQSHRATSKDAGSESGRFLAHWHDLLDTTVITPAAAHGQLRCGRDVADATAAGKMLSSSASSSLLSDEMIFSVSLSADRKRRGPCGGLRSGRTSARSSRPSTPLRPASASAWSSAPVSASASPAQSPGISRRSSLTAVDLARPANAPNVQPVIAALGTQFKAMLVSHERGSEANA